VKVNGEIATGWLEWQVDSNTFYQADTFRIDFSVSKLAQDRGIDWWADQTEVFIEIFAGFPSDPLNFTAADLESLIYGRVDEIDFDPSSRNLTVCGRDLTSYFIDTKTTQQWVNHTASQIAIELAQSHGLTPVVKKTSTKVGSYYQIDNVLVTNQHSEWDLLSYLATKESRVVYCKGKELHFESKDHESEEPYVLSWQQPSDDNEFPLFNGKSLRVSRNLSVAKGVVVWVQAFNVKTGKAFSVGYPVNRAKGTKPGQASPGAQVYTYRLRGMEMTDEAALQYAQAKHKEITQHEVRLSVSMPADNLLKSTSVLQLTGTNSAFDQIYYPDAITRYMSASAGYTMNFTAKNIAKVNEGVL
jgi:phage protein D